MARTTSTDDDVLLDMDDVCRITKHGRTKVKELIKSGDLPSFKLGEGHTSKRLVWQSDLNAYLRRQAARHAIAQRPARGRRTASAA